MKFCTGGLHQMVSSEFNFSWYQLNITSTLPEAHNKFY